MLTQERLKELLHYDPETGVFTWRVARPNGIRPGMIAGGINIEGYVVFGVDGKTRKAHRLAHLYMTGEWPKHQVDHKDRDRANNAWANLREATNRQNMQNRVAAGSIGLKGVAKHGSRYRARIQVDGRPIIIGTFQTPEDAHAAYVKAANDNFGEFARAA